MDNKKINIDNLIRKSSGINDIYKMSHNVDFILILSNKINYLYETFYKDSSNKLFYLIHYKTGENSQGVINGHWCGLYVNKKLKVVIFFDSYGYFPDFSKELMTEKYLIKSGQTHKDICNFIEFLQNKGYKAYYNEIRFQKLKDGINTCGRYIAYFFRFFNEHPNKSLKYFQDLLKSYISYFGIKDKNYDKLITILTMY